MSSSILLILILISIGLFFFRNWRIGIQAALVTAVLEGAFRKWILPDASELIYLLKDIILLSSYTGFFFSEKLIISTISKKYISWTRPIIYMMIAWAWIQVANPSSDSLIVTLFGLKNYLFYVPLLWLVPKSFESESQLKQFMLRFLMLLIPVASLAILQFFSPPDSIFNIYAPSAVDLGIALSGNNQNVRVTGTFSYIAGYSVYLGLCLSLLLPLLTERQSTQVSILKLVSFFLMIITLFMTGARGLLFSSIIVIVGYIILQGKRIFNFFVKFLVRLTGPIVILYFIINRYFNDAVIALWLRVTLNQDIENRVIDLFAEPFRFLETAGLLGYGPGSAFQGSLAIRNLLNLGPGATIPVYYESEPGRVTLEIGFIGFLIWYSFRIILLIVNWKIYSNLKSSFLKNFSISILLIQCLSLIGQIVFNHTANLFYWFLNGLILALPYLEQQKLVKYGFVSINRSSNS